MKFTKIDMTMQESGKKGQEGKLQDIFAPMRLKKSCMLPISCRLESSGVTKLKALVFGKGKETF
jgi:hypothetical protein